MCDHVGGIVGDIGGAVLATDSRAGSVHLTIVIPVNDGVAQAVDKINASLSVRLAKAMPGLRWQDSYEVLKVTQSVLSQMERYLIGEMERHEKFAFQEELANLLAGHGIDCDVSDWPT